MQVTRILTPLATGILAIGAPLGVATAQAPTADTAFLPPNGPAAPLEPTTQREQCTIGALDPQFGPTTSQSAEHILRYSSVWPLSRGKGQTVAVIDTGVTPHPRLRNVIPGGDFVSSGDGTSDCDAHGTLVAGIIAAQESPFDGFAGVAPDATILSIRQSSLKFGRLATLDDTDGYQSENSYGTVHTLAMAVRRAADLGATVINISEVACVPANIALNDRALGAALAYAVDVKDVVVVVAAGNLDGQSCRNQNPTADPISGGYPNWDTISTNVTPARYDDYVIAVASTDTDGAPSVFSLAGPWVDIAAPGTEITSLDPAPGAVGLINGQIRGGDVSGIAGTSYATPFVAGTAALIRERFPHLTAREVKDRIIATAHSSAQGWNPQVGFGIVDPVAAVTADVAPVGVSGSLGYAANVEKGPHAEKASERISAPEPETDESALPRVIAGLVAFGFLVTALTALLLISSRK
ncbi:type VII secretion-associated serine protease mycosin [Hoyosella rhizosphaerae]|nr:type VII secretion-associated serine protease mycosin [Hoyosella rhizosphaerae]